MFCEHCHGRAANVHLVRIINGKKSELHLCNECAQGERFKQTENLLKVFNAFYFRKKII